MELKVRKEEQPIVEQTITEQSPIAEQSAVEESKEEKEAPSLTVTLTTEESADEQRAPAWVKEVRKRNRELERELRDARKKLNAMNEPKETQLGPKPTLEGHDYDTTKFESALAEWVLKKHELDEKAAKEAAEAKTAEQTWQAKLTAFESAKTELNLPDYEDAEATVLETLNQVQQGIIVHGAKNPALLVYALGKNEAETRRLAAIKDPVEFSFAVARLEERMKVEGKKPATPPETRVVSSQPVGTFDNTLERLRAEAAKTGDYTKVIAYKKQHK